MKAQHILVPVDFSDCSLAAFKAAVNIGRQLGAEMTILHAAELPDGWENWPEREKDQNPYLRMVEKEALTQLKSLYDLAHEAGVEAHTKVTSGTVAEAVDEVVESIGVDLIVMGSHGAHAKQEYFIGSNAQKVLRKIEVPLLVLKDGLGENIEFKKAVFASSLIEEDKEVLQRFVDFAKRFGLEEIHILAVDTTNYFTQPGFVMIEALKDFEEVVQGVRAFTSFQKDTSVEAGVRHYSEDHDIDLIGVSNREKNVVKRIFTGSNVEMLINHCSVPVLSLDWT